LALQLRLKEVAHECGWTLARLQREAKLSMPTARRYWFSSSTGLARDAGTLRAVRLGEIDKISRTLQVAARDLFIETEGENQ
jgi:hypothetical protein